MMVKNSFICGILYGICLTFLCNISGQAEKKSLEIMELLDIADKSNRLVETLSRGMQQKTALAIALSFDTPIIFLDEPTLGLDLESRNNLINFFQKQNAVKEKLFIISSHDLEFITSICKDIYILREGVINKYDDIPRKSVFRVLSKFPLNSLDLYRNLNIVNDFCYDIPCDLLQLLSLTSEEQGFIKSISNLKYDLESLLLK